ncbi:MULTISPECIES: neutral zinc metallopeptidase [Cyanophyceae]|uniref:KPN_02809 family neutral zinc metallopeptidase n=1 Tax=Cyanophyceae TaxID=3028117 RepID=UPI00168A02E6|nr:MULTISPECIES: neutral zinc metallopeptidase [Cyanophyceae]MBD1916351.1 neutral zinc metallopeptidase [Phormidium sp. FACHB-77]MBD2032643.1 neutral zinc metallopeptidase [Phormidium sp. FACHB-322]MBD2050015.1 neutral zinc metallopeptidase [Leptolyngbya sp. FACHB-60]
MKWQSSRRSLNIDDRRGMPGGGAAIGGLGSVLLALVVALLGGDPSVVLERGVEGNPYEGAPQASSEESDRAADFVAAVLGETEDTWHSIFQSEFGAAYQEPGLVLYSGATQSACGRGQAAMGPFYCPADQKVYLDTSFFRDLQVSLGAPGDFAQAYVIAHEVGHHVQNLLGVSSQVQRAQQRVSQTEANELSVRLELQADCFAGVWANRAQRSREILEEGDIEEALNAASQIGDDRLQMESQGYVTPDSFTHGSSQQRAEWFYRGIETGDINQCNTFDVDRI